MRVRRIGLLLLAALPLTLGAAALAQTQNAGVVGNVTDPSGAVLPGVEVQVRNVETGAAFDTVADDAGRYVVPRILRPGTYIVEAKLEGFATTVSGPFVLRIGDERQVDIKLSLGAITQEVTVTGTTPLLASQTSSVGEVIEGRQISELPLKDRNFTQLATLTPGVSRSFVGVLSDATFFNQGNPNAGSIPGGSNPQGATEAARFSRSGGASISANGLRPTQNNFSLDGVDNNEPQFGTIGVFPNPDAIQEFKVETSVPKAETGRGGAVVNTTFKSGTNDFHGSLYYYGQNDNLNAAHAETNRRGLDKPEFRINEFGGTLGGPIAKDRTFFFFDYLGQRNATPFTFATAVPTALSRIGNFTEFDEPVIDPTTGEPFPGNIIPQERLIPQALAFLDLYPLPNRETRNPRNSGDTANFVSNRDNEESIDSFNIKVDHRLSDLNNLTGRFSFSDQKRVRASFFPNVPSGFGAGDEIGDTRQFVLSDTHVFRPTLINEFRFGWTEIDLGIFNPGVGGTQGISPSICQDLGIPNCNDGSLEGSGMMLTGGFGNGEFEFAGDGGLFRVNSNNFYIADSVTLIRGNHTYKFGFEARPRRVEIIDGGRSGSLKGNLQYSDDFDATTGNVQADYLLGVPAGFVSRGTVPGGPFDLTTTEWSFFIQDDWKVAPNLTLNMGLRYDVFEPVDEDEARLANYDFAQRSLVLGNGNVETDKNNFGPRIGFAWGISPEKRVVVRGGYGLLYALDGTDYPPLIRNPPLTGSVTFDSRAGNQGNFSLATGPPVASVSGEIRPETNLFFVEPEQTVGEIQQWSLGIQWEFVQDYLLDVTYAGNHSTHLLATRELGNNGNGLGLARTPDGDVLGSVIAYENRASSNYNGLQVKLNKRLSRGFSFNLSYTWSHTIDDSTGVFNGAGESRGNAGGPVNPLDLSGERGNSTLDVRQLFSSNLLWDIPSGGVTGPAKAFLGGWQANFIFNARTGQNFDVTCDTPSGRTRCDLVGDPFSGEPPGFFLNRDAFAAPTTSVINEAGREVFVGNLGRLALRGPGHFRTDFSVFKRVALTEQWQLLLGMEFFNLFNSNDQFVPGNHLSDGNFGIFENALPPRTIQYRLKLSF